MKTARADFARQAFQYALAATNGKKHLAWVGAAMACIETGWGELVPIDTHNWLGIKPTRNQPRKGVIRVFRSVEECWKSWAYLVQLSRYYAKPRKHLAIPPSTPEPDKVAAHIVFAREFVAVYCSANLDYPDLICTVMHEIKGITLDGQLLRKRDYCTAAPDWLPCAGDIGVSCCKPHDMAYAAGGTKKDRLDADRGLRDAIYEQAKSAGHPWRGWMVSRAYYRGVRLFGASFFHFRKAKDK